MNQKYRKMKLEAKLKEEEILKQKISFIEEMSTSPQRSVSGSDNHDGMRRNSSFVEMNQNQTRRMKDDGLDHTRVLSNSKHPITRICLTGGPCAGKTTALATLSTVLT